MTAPLLPGTVPAARPSVSRALLWPVASVALGFLLIYNTFNAPSVVPPPVGAAASAPATLGAAAPAADLALPPSVPKRLSITEIAVDAPFTALAIGKSGHLNAPPPDDTNLVGWFAGGATPGERGTAVVAGHVDTRTGPAVFLQLSALKPGSKVNITREDDTVATFKVDSVETFSKASFPNQRVYADTPSPQLRLITCGGSYDKKKKDYTENVVVFAHLDSTKRA